MKKQRNAGAYENLAGYDRRHTKQMVEVLDDPGEGMVDVVLHALREELAGRASEDDLDVEEAERRLADPTDATVSLADLRRELGR